MPGSFGHQESHHYSAPQMVLWFVWVFFFTFGSTLHWEGELVCVAIFGLLCNYAREGVLKPRGLDSEKEVVFF